MSGAGITWPGRLARLGIRLYQRVISPWLGQACRYEPTCSCYAEEAIFRYGLWRGVSLAGRRLARCHPFGGCGFDPVP